MKKKVGICIDYGCVYELQKVTKKQYQKKKKKTLPSLAIREAEISPKIV